MIEKLGGIGVRWERVIPAGVLGCMLIGCDTPPDIQPIAPPGAPVLRKDPAAEPPQALGEMPTSTKTPAEPGKESPPPPAPPTAKGETKTTPAGVKYETLKEGAGPELKAGQVGAFLYVGKLQDGTVFDTNRKADAQPFKVDPTSGMVIKGWAQALPGMKVGELRKLTIPPDQGYGTRGFGDKIPPGATLTFEVELTSIIGP